MNTFRLYVFFGVIIDDKLKFNLHINENTKKNSKNNGILYKLKQYVPCNILLSIYHSIIECYINYCNLIFGNAAGTHISPLEIAQKKAIRIVANQPPRSHTNPIFSSLKILKISDLYKYNLGIYMWKNEINFAQYFQINLYNTRSGDHYVPSVQRLTLAQNQSIYHQVLLNWHDIPLDIKSSPSLVGFKRKYKSHLISYYLSEDV